MAKSFLNKYELKKTFICDILNASGQVKEVVSGNKGKKVYRTWKVPYANLEKAMHE